MFLNKVFCKEVELNCFLYSIVVKSVCNVNDNLENGMNVIVFVIVVLVWCRNFKMLVLVYRIFLILFYSGVSYDVIRLYYLGICMLFRMMIDLYYKMGVNLDFKVMVWKWEIEKNKVVVFLLEEVREK